MNKVNIIFTIVILIVLSIIFYLIDLRKISSKKKKKKEILEIKYLVNYYNIKKERILNKKFLLFTSIINAFIIAIVFFIITLIPLKTVWQLLIGFVLLFGLIYSIYGIIGKVLVIKGYNK